MKIGKSEKPPSPRSYHCFHFVTWFKLWPVSYIFRPDIWHNFLLLKCPAFFMRSFTRSLRFRLRVSLKICLGTPSNSPIGFIEVCAHEPDVHIKTSSFYIYVIGLIYKRRFLCILTPLVVFFFFCARVPFDQVAQVPRKWTLCVVFNRHAYHSLFMLFICC